MTIAALTRRSHGRLRGPRIELLHRRRGERRRSVRAIDRSADHPERTRTDRARRAQQPSRHASSTSPARGPRPASPRRSSRTGPDDASRTCSSVLVARPSMQAAGGAGLRRPLPLDGEALLNAPPFTSSESSPSGSRSSTASSGISTPPAPRCLLHASSIPASSQTFWFALDVPAFALIPSPSSDSSWLGSRSSTASSGT